MSKHKLQTRSARIESVADDIRSTYEHAYALGEEVNHAWLVSTLSQLVQEEGYQKALADVVDGLPDFLNRLREKNN